MNDKLIRVVLIDDDQEDFLIIQDLLAELEPSKYLLKWIPNFEEGVKALEDQSADVYLIDYMLNGKTGLDLIDSIGSIGERELTKPMILLTGYGTRELDVRAMEKGVSNFLSKDALSTEVLERSIRYGVKTAEDQERLRTTERMRAEKEAAEVANQAKSLFLANISHEIRTPISAIIGFTDLALSKTTSEQEREEFLHIIKRNGKHLLDLVNDVLDISKIEEGKIDVKKENCPWESTIVEVMDIFRPVTLEKHVQLELRTSPGIPKQCLTDTHFLKQILLNLLGNAVKFTSHGTITVQARLNDFAGKTKLKISVSDTGAGISQIESEKLFQPFSQVGSGKNRKYGGTGLGLSLSRKLANALGGALELEKSGIGQGSTFTLTIPFDHPLRDAPEV